MAAAHAVSELSKRDEQLLSNLVKRIKVPINSTSSLAELAAVQRDPWSKAGQYALGWTYFAIVVLLVTTALRCYHLWGDKIRTALFKQEIIDAQAPVSAEEYQIPSAQTDSSTRGFFPARGPLPEKPKDQSSTSTIRPLNLAIASFRWIFYRPVPVLRIGRIRIVSPSLGASVVVLLATAFVVLYCFIPQPFYYQSMSFGSPPLAIRAGMMSVAMMPWIIGLGMKANIISVMTGIGHERLNVLHRWAGYICLLLALIHTIPFYVQPLWDPSGFAAYKTYFAQHWYIYTTGLAAIGPLGFLCLHSLPFLRSWGYELFLFLHVPASFAFLAMLFWHCNNYLTSWSYLWATVAIWLSSYLIRLFYLNWTNPLRMSWLIGEECAVTILPENAVKVTVPTQTKWRPGQYVYLRMPGVAIFENHPFTIASLCSDDFPSEYGPNYRDMTLVFRPFGGFTRKVYDTSLRKGPYKTYRAFIDGPYGGMQRQMASFDHVIFFAGGSGITALASQLLDLIKRMRDGKAVTKQVHVVWALKRPETMEWFKEELRICREFAPPGSVQCSFYITASKRFSQGPDDASHTPRRSRPNSQIIRDKIDDMFQGVASKRNSALIHDDVVIDAEREKRPEQETGDSITALPNAHLAPPRPSYQSSGNGITASHSPTQSTFNSFGGGPFPPSPMFPVDPYAPQASQGSFSQFNFGFPNNPSKFQKSLMRFAFLPTNARNDGWRTEYGRPDIPYMLKELGDRLGRRTCVFVCGPPSMRVDVANSVAKLQTKVWQNKGLEEIHLHAENYAI